MNCQIGNHQHVPVHIDKAACQFFVLQKYHPARHGECPVQPCAHNHAAVFFRIQPDILLSRHLRILLDFKGRRITVRRRNVKAFHSCKTVLPFSLQSSLRYRKRCYGRVIPRHKIPAALRKSPLLCLFQLCVALRKQLLFDALHRMKSTWAFLYKGKQLFGTCFVVSVIFHCHSLSFTAMRYYHQNFITQDMALQV